MSYRTRKFGVTPAFWGRGGARDGVSSPVLQWNAREPRQLLVQDLRLAARIAAESESARPR
jgi:hypothetical protein